VALERSPGLSLPGALAWPSLSRARLDTRPFATAVISMFLARKLQARLSGVVDARLLPWRLMRRNKPRIAPI
jgi:hypothetical protein